jgi:hypothetical protein
MRRLALTLLLLAATAAPAEAAVRARSFCRGGRAGPRGAAVVQRPYGYYGVQIRARLCGLMATARIAVG